MFSLGVLFLLVAAATAALAHEAVPAVAEATVSVKCSLTTVKGVAVQGAAKPVYLCSSDSEGADFLLAIDSNEPTVEAVVAKDALAKIKEPTRTPKRRFGGGRPGFGGGGGFANAQASAFGGGGGGYGRPGFGGGFANAQASAGGFGGGFGR